ncbi:alpha/beta hydrolase [Rhodoblastus acidophilus]|uniref:Alpha/beta hydrolase n=1 Tax=Candidatus Rhodoblastus alkanivorans TaxID=2954117 RepID=A0ABS9Z8Z6_9HYPH|nr:alpha/beta fold hydrolase [Candidatus Rhodoblastus alkanivorans]MCI4680273.1 alpha/beta hydrolase [Candidatus Rhodoblastus alkanivorans]MCI4683092.1 alpha/beta hydrolase [Candidatus Rhodoblastus alkanivorans]MDI4640403.1 alpha/beta hydrolase [Rhodoblastus acidophilus]
MIATLAGAAALLLAGSWFAGEITVRLRRKPPDLQPGAPARDLLLRATDGTAIATTFWPGAEAGAPAVLLLHGLYDSRADFVDHARWLTDEGFAVMAIDFRGHGRSGAAPHSFGWSEALDARAAFDWLRREQRRAPIGVLGVSLGGAAALLGPEGPLPCDALALQAVYPDIRRAARNRVAAFLSRPVAVLLEPLLSYQSIWRFGVRPERLAPIEALARFNRPVLIVGGGADRFTPPEETREMYDAAPGPKELLILEGLDHDETSHVTTDGYRNAILHFFRSTLGAAPRRQKQTT